MPNIFISYAKKDTRSQAAGLHNALNALPGVTAWMDMSLEADESWAQQIEKKIDQADYIVVLLSPDVNRRPPERRSFVLNEIDYARQEQKPILPVMVINTRLPVQLAGVQFIDLRAAPNDLTPIIQRVCKRFNIPAPSSTAEIIAQPVPPPARRLPLWIGGIAALVLLIGLAGIALSGGGNTPAPTMTISPTPPAVGLAPSETPAPFLPTDLPTLSSFEQLQTAQMQITNSAATQAAVDLTATQGAILNANATAAAQQIMATEAAAQATLLALSWTPTLRSTNTSTPTPQPTLTSLEAALTAARNFTGSNADWQALYPDGYEHVFADGVPMVLVPAGCFMMGSMEGDNTELPIHEQCFESPFWIDITEVTQDDFTRLGGVQNLTSRYLGGNRPVDSINWFEARDFCALRNAALPTETEWEYAARGPDSWEYPWGNTWISDYMVWHGTANEQTAIVRSRPLGRSWIGAFDLSGNVLEWTRSIEAPYPYVSTDGREAYMESQTFVMRVLRGGGWNSDTPSNFRAAFRLPFGNNGGNNIIGFRCIKYQQ